MRPDQIPDWETLDLAACYRLKLKIASKPNEYSGVAQVTFTNTTGVALDEVVFRTYPNADRIFGGSLTISEAQVGGLPVQPQVYLEDRTAVRLILPQLLSQEETIEIELGFSGQLPQDFGGSARLYGVFNYTTSEQVLTLANWFPILAPWINGGWQVEPVVGIGDAVVSEAALYLVEVTAPDSWQVIATGSQIDSSRAEGLTTTTFASGPARDFFISASPSFVLRSQELNGVRINHWGLPAGEERWEEVLQATVDSLSVYDELYGLYPYAELDVADAPLRLASGVEYPGVFLIGSQMYIPNVAEPYLLGIVVSHEAAHQWWYGVVGNDVLTHPWQDEALATYSSLLYQQVHQPLVYKGTLVFYESRVDNLEDAEVDTDVDQSVAAFTDEPSAYSLVVYLKGALFFVELQELIGDEAFFDALQAYYRENMYDLVAPQTLLDAFEAACGCELDSFYEEWGVD